MPFMSEQIVKNVTVRWAEAKTAYLQQIDRVQQLFEAIRQNILTATGQHIPHIQFRIIASWMGCNAVGEVLSTLKSQYSNTVHLDAESGCTFTGSTQPNGYFGSKIVSSCKFGDTWDIRLDDLESRIEELQKITTQYIRQLCENTLLP